MANLHSKLSQNIESIAYYKKAIALEPENIMAHLYLGFSYMDEKMYENAVVEIPEGPGVKFGSYLHPVYRWPTAYESMLELEKAGRTI